MDELKFVLRCFIFAAFFLVLTQIKVDSQTIENHIESSLVNSRVANLVNKVADGGAKLINDGYHYTIDFYQEWKNEENSAPTHSSATSQKADRKVTRAQTEPNSEEDAELVIEE